MTQISIFQINKTAAEKAAILMDKTHKLMGGQKVSFNLELSNKIYKANLTSLIDVSKDSIEEQKKQYKFFIEQLSDEKEIRDWSDKGSHYANIEWLLLNSIFISAFSFFEHHVFAISRVVEDRATSKIKIEDLSGKGINKFCNYLFLVGQIKSADRSLNKWQEIFYFQKVRNLLVHNGGIMISDTTKKLENHECYNFLKKHEVIMAGTLGHIRIRGLDFIEAFSQLTATISDNLTAEILSSFN